MIKSLDYWLGKYSANECIGFLRKNPSFKSETDKTMNLSEWQDYRDNELLGKNDWESWMYLLAGKERIKFFLFDFLSTRFSKKSKILDVGCGQAHISMMLHYTGFDITLAEYDKSVVPRRISPFSNMFRDLDITNISIGELVGFTDILLVQVDYIFDSATLKTFLRKCRNAEVNVHFINTQVLGPLRFLKFKQSEKSRSNNPAAKEHGYMRSLGCYKELATACQYTKCNIKRLNGSKETSGTLSSYFYIEMVI